MRLGLQLPEFLTPGDPSAMFEHVARAARAAEDAGFDAVWVMDHFYEITGRPADPMPEGYVLLAAIAARTERVRLGTLVTGVTYRNPAMLAKMVTTLDMVSSGRAICGLGAGWNQQEHIGYGYDFPGAKERLDRLEEAVQICRLMFTEATPSFTGTYYRIVEALNEPRPVTPGGPPIMVGGSGEKRTLKIVARYADACNLFGSPDVLRHKLEVLDAHCADAGRDPATITRTALKTVVIAPTAEAAAAKARAEIARRGIDPEVYERITVVGDPDTVGERLAAVMASGLDGLIVNLPNPYDDHTIALAGQTLAALF